MHAEQIRALLARLTGQPIERLPDDLPLRNVVVDSFDMVELVIQLQEETGLRLNHEELRSLSTVGDVLRHFADETAGQELGSG